MFLQMKPNIMQQNKSNRKKFCDKKKKKEKNAKHEATEEVIKKRNNAIKSLKNVLSSCMKCLSKGICVLCNTKCKRQQ